MIIRYKGGLGNQMFQYVLRCNAEQLGYIVEDDISCYEENSDSMPFKLTEVFPNTRLNRTVADVRKIVTYSNERTIFQKAKNVIFPSSRNYYCEKKALCYDKSVLKMRKACVEGYWQAAQYAENVKDTIFHRFVFSEKMTTQVCNLAKDIKNKNSVSVHIRAGDYLNPENSSIFGGICTLQYYQKAIAIMREMLENPIFYVFSNDIAWCKKQFDLENVVWMDVDTLSEHEDWEEMYLMSCCKNNIIANSSFSWWGAFLNQNKKKIVVAPKRWMNDDVGNDICPKEWIRI